MINTEKKFLRVLVAVDGSRPSIKAAEYAIDFAKENNCELIILHIIDFYRYPYILSTVALSPTYGSPQYAEEKSKAEELMNTLKEKFNRHNNNPNIKTEIIEGATSVAATIVEYAESSKVDLIIVGSRGITGFKRLLIGSVASDVVKYAHCSVLVFR